MGLGNSAVESLGLSRAFWQGKKVFITGHTGFKGSWLSLWLQQLGANVVGFALPPFTTPSLFEKARVAEDMHSITGDIRDAGLIKQIVLETQPDIIFHLAAQALVRESYRQPVETYQTNVMGTLHVLEAIRACPSICAAVMVTTDKCYENKEWLWAYRENEALGGRDPYSSSKACAELLIASYRQSFFSEAKSPAIASARAGNVIGGGDWSEGRLIPDILKAFTAGQPIKIRYPDSIRPWQFVLDPLAGYLMLAERLYSKGHSYAQAWNFGPNPDDVKPVKWIVEQLSRFLPGSTWEIDYAEQCHEAKLLKLDSAKAREQLGWQTQFNLRKILLKITEWHRAEMANADMGTICLTQINEYQQTLHSKTL